MLTLWDVPLVNLPTCSELLGFLQICDRVVSLHLRSAGPRDELGVEHGGTEKVIVSTVNLPALEIFVVEYREKSPSLATLRFFLSHIRQERLKAFTLRCYSKPFSNENFNAMVPRSLCPVNKIHSVQLSYPTLRSMHFVVRGDSAHHTGRTQEDSEFSFAYGARGRHNNADLGPLTLSALQAWGMAGVKTLTISLIGSFTQQKACPRQYILGPNPQDILMRFSALTTICIMGKGPAYPAIARQFVEALLPTNSEGEKSTPPALYQLCDLKVDHVVPTRQLRSALHDFQQVLANDGLHVKCWINGSVMLQSNQSN